MVSLTRCCLQPFPRPHSFPELYIETSKTASFGYLYIAVDVYIFKKKTLYRRCIKVLGLFSWTQMFEAPLLYSERKAILLKTWVYRRGIWLYIIYFIFFHEIRFKNFFFLNAEYDDFRNFKTTFCKTFSIPGETETRNVYSRASRNKTGNYSLSVFFFVGQCYQINQELLVLQWLPNISKELKSIEPIWFKDSPENCVNAFRTHLSRSLISFNVCVSFDIDNNLEVYLNLIYESYNTYCKIKITKTRSVRREKFSMDDCCNT